MLNGRPWKNNICRYNISENDGRTNAGGITLFKEGSATILDSVNIYNNTVYMTPAPNNTHESAFRVSEWYTGINHVMIYNNIFITTGGVPLVYVPVGYSAYFAGNLYWSSGGTFVINYQGITYNEISSWRTATNNEKVGATNTGIIADPLLINNGAGGTLNPNPTSSLTAYKESSNSPAINAGLNLSALFNLNTGTHDYWGNSMPFGSASDIGANESLFTSCSCDVPTNILATGITSSNATLNWTGNLCAYKYRIQYRKQGINSWTYATTLAPNVSKILTSLTANSIYEYQIRSECDSAATIYSAYSAIQTFTTLCSCSKPTNIIVSNVTQTGAVINWTGNACAVKYRLQYRKQGTNSWTTKSILAPTTTKQLTSLTSNSIYEYRMRTDCNNNGSINSGFTSISNFSTLLRLENQESNSKSSMNILPNPCSNCEITGIINENDLLITDVLGRKLNVTFEKSTSGYFINLNSKGVFIVRNLRTGEVVKFVKE